MKKSKSKEKELARKKFLQASQAERTRMDGRLRKKNILYGAEWWLVEARQRRNILFADPAFMGIKNFVLEAVKKL